VSAACLPAAIAQVHGTPTSVTSIGFGEHFDRVPGVRSSVTSVGPRGYNDPTRAFNPNSPNCCINPLFPSNPNPSRDGEHRTHHHPYPVGGYYAIPYPVYVTEPGVDDTMEEPEAQQPMVYGAGPTIFDRRDSSQSSLQAEAAYAERMRVPSSEPAPQVSTVAPVEATPARGPQTVLVFKDGHQLEVQNYAILGSTLYDVSPGHRSKVALADLDLDATMKQNDDRGIDFQLPAKPISN
jgi:hypothetical protein